MSVEELRDAMRWVFDGYGEAYAFAVDGAALRAKRDAVLAALDELERLRREPYAMAWHRDLAAAREGGGG